MSELERLDADIAALRAAIAKAQETQEISFEGRRVRRGDLAAMYQRLDALERRREAVAGPAAGGGGGPRVSRGTPL